MAFYTPAPSYRPRQEVLLQSRSGKLVHQPMPMIGLRGLSTLPGSMPIQYSPSSVVQHSPAAMVTQVRAGISRAETLRMAAPGPGLPVTSGDPSLMTGIVRALQAHLDALGTGGWWVGADRNWAVAGRDALAGLALDANGHYSATAVRDAILSMPSAVRGRLDSNISGSSLSTARALAGYTTARLLSDIAAGRYTRAMSSSGGGLNPGALRDVGGRTAGGGSGGSVDADSLVDRLRSFPGGGGGPGPITTDIMPTVTPEQLDAIRHGEPVPMRQDGTVADFMRGVSFGQIAGAVTGFALGLGLLLLRKR